MNRPDRSGRYSIQPNSASEASWPLGRAAAQEIRDSRNGGGGAFCSMKENRTPAIVHARDARPVTTRSPLSSIERSAERHFGHGLVCSVTSRVTTYNKTINY